VVINLWSLNNFEEKLLLGALVTITAQTLPGVERIVVDNNSSDRTRAIAAACGFMVVEEPRQSIARARQAGLEAARGTIYASVDADTLYPLPTPAPYETNMQRTHTLSVQEASTCSSLHGLASFSIARW
jgi:hypothetical protein